MCVCGQTDRGTFWDGKNTKAMNCGLVAEHGSGIQGPLARIRRFKFCDLRENNSISQESWQVECLHISATERSFLHIAGCLAQSFAAAFSEVTLCGGMRPQKSEAVLAELEDLRGNDVDWGDGSAVLME